MKRVVIDTNVLVSALLFGGTPGKLIPLWKNGIIEPVASKAIFAEYLRVLAYPRFDLSEQEIDYLLSAEILPWVDIVEVPPGEPVVPDDPADDKFVWCALAAGADAIISGDEHLLELDLPQLPILTPGQFLKRLKP
jgi:putative PIN family toxin of toxin-antitoxin system